MEISADQLLGSLLCCSRLPALPDGASHHLLKCRLRLLWNDQPILIVPAEGPVDLLWLSWPSSSSSDRPGGDGDGVGQLVFQLASSPPVMFQLLGEWAHQLDACFGEGRAEGEQSCRSNGGDDRQQEGQQPQELRLILPFGVVLVLDPIPCQEQGLSSYVQWLFVRDQIISGLNYRRDWVGKQSRKLRKHLIQTLARQPVFPADGLPEEQLGQLFWIFARNFPA